MEKLFNQTNFLNQSDAGGKNLIRIADNLIVDSNSSGRTTPNILNLDISNHKVIAEAEMISLLLNRISEEQTPVYIKSNSSSDAFPFKITSIDNVSDYSHVRLNRSNHEDDHDFSGYNELLLFFHDQLTFYTFNTTKLYLEQDIISVALPRSIMQLWRRSHPKSRIKLEDQNIHANILTGNNEEYTFPVNDIGYRGFSVNLPDSDAARALEQTPIKIHINTGDDLDMSFEACLKYMNERSSSKNKTLRCGFEITGINEDKKDELRAYIFRHNYPDIVPFHVKYLDRIWDLFFKSGYMIPEKTEYVKKVKRKIEDTWVRLYDEKSKIGKMLLFVDNDVVYGTVAAAKSYENAWIVHQVAGIKHPSVATGKYVLDSIMINLIEHIDLKYVKVYFRKNNAWAIQKFFKFREYCTLKNAISYSSLDLYEIDIEDYKHHKTGKAADVEIDYLSSPADRNVIMDYVSETTSEIVLNTESFNHGGFDLPETQFEYDNIGLFRGRKILTAKMDNRIVSFAILEYGSTGINIGGLLDIFNIFTIDQSCKDINTINRIMIDEIVNYYNSLGKKTALCLTDDLNKDILIEAGFSKKLDYVTWYVDNKCLNQITQHFYDSYTHVKKK